MSTIDLGKLSDTIERMGATLADAWGATASLTCAEVDTIAAVLVAAGRADLAADVIIDHAGSGPSGDDGGDSHYAVTKAAGKGNKAKANKRARKYVRRLV